MEQLTYVGARQLEWREVEPPQLTDDGSVIVKPLTVATCDMDGVIISGLLPMKGPVPLGHEGEGVVTKVGGAVKRWKVGDRVIIPWKIACGHCPSCGRGHTAQCATVPPEDAFGWGPTSPQWGGFLSDAVVVPFADHMLSKLPDGVDPLKVCGVSDNITDGWRAVGPHLRERPGGTVLIASAMAPGSIGLYAAGIAVALGASKVIYADVDRERLERASMMGAEPIMLTEEVLKNLATDRRTLSGGFDITVDAFCGPTNVPHLLAATARAGVFVSTAAIMYRGQPVSIDLFDLYRKSASMHTGWVHTHSLLEEPLQLNAEGRFDPTPVVSHCVDWKDADEALAEPFTKVIVSRDA